MVQREKEKMKPLRHTFFPFEPQSALRSTQTQNWLTKITEQEALAIENSYKIGYDRKGKEYWVRMLKNGKQKTLRSKPNHVRTKRYLDKYFKYKEDLKAHADSIGFIMPQDAFFMWFFMPMPKTWTKKKKAAMAFKLHKNKKDTDNLSKAIKDALAPRKSNFVAGSMPAMDDRVISSYANAKIYLPDEYSDKVGILIVEYWVHDFLYPFWYDAMKIIGIDKRNEVPPDFL